MNVLGAVSTDQVIQVYEGDSKVLEVSNQWPDTPFMRLVLVRIAQRPVDRILGLTWELWELTKDEFLQTVCTVWPKEPFERTHSWTFQEMFAAIDKDDWKLQDEEKWKKVETWKAKFEKNRSSEIGRLIGYYRSEACIHLEDGHTRLTAAHLAGVFPDTVRMYIGKAPARPEVC